MTQFNISRRSALAGAASLPFIASAASNAQAAAPMMGESIPNFMRVKVGDFEVTNLMVGSRVVEGPQNIFGMNASAEDFATASAAAGIPTDKVRFYFTPTVVNTGSELVLFDTGLNGAATVGVLEAAGYTADQIDIVVITHMHGDHVGGLSGDTGVTFPNARYVTGRVEFDAWAAQDNDTFKAKVAPLAEQFTFLEDGGSAASGITAMAAFGHTPGHMAYMIDSAGKQLAICADFANHYVWSLAYPDWEVRFDMDKAAAAATRKRMLDMMATDKIAFTGYHMPFPAFGYVDKPAAGGYAWVAHSYQMTL